MKKFAFCITLLLTTLSGCGKPHKPVSQKPTVAASNAPLQNGQYAKWHQAVSENNRALGGSSSGLRNYFSDLSAYEPSVMGRAWIKDMASDAASHPVFIENVRNRAGKNKKAFIRELIKQPNRVKSVSGAKEAFITALNQAGARDSLYRRAEQKFEAKARGAGLPTEKFYKPVSDIQMASYLSATPGNPSVAERILVNAAAKVLSVDKEPDLSVSLDRLANNGGMTNCLNMAQKNSAQCGAASSNDNDLNYCVARHGVGEVSRCFSWILPNT